MVSFFTLGSRASRACFAAFVGFAFAACPSEPQPNDRGVVSPLDVASETILERVPCTQDADCFVLGARPCERALCGSDGHCEWDPDPDGSPCSTGNGCIVGQVCKQGSCDGGEPKPPCTGQECGVDACGNACGTCSGAFTCEEGQCAAVLCNGITWQGCCTGDGTVQWCDDGMLSKIVCPEGMLPERKHCGWDGAKGLYDCGQEEASEPSGSYAYLCPDAECPPDPCAGMNCGYACGQLCGECGALEVCADGTCIDAPNEPDVHASDVNEDDTSSDATDDVPFNDLNVDSEGPNDDTMVEEDSVDDSIAEDIETDVEDAPDVGTDASPLDVEDGASDAAASDIGDASGIEDGGDGSE